MVFFNDAVTKQVESLFSRYPRLPLYLKRLCHVLCRTEPWKVALSSVQLKSVWGKVPLDIFPS